MKPEELAKVEIPQEGWREAPQFPDRPAPQGGKLIEVSAGGFGGYRTAWYEVVEDRLVLRDEGDHDNLAGNSVVCDFEGLTLDEAYEKRDAIRSGVPYHDRCGCHACTFNVWIEEDSEPPAHLRYSAPQEAEIIKAALAVFHKEHGSMGKLKKAVRALD